MDHTKDTDVVMPMDISIEYSHNYSKTSGILWQYYRNEAVTNNNGVIIDFRNDPDSASFKSNKK